MTKDEIEADRLALLRVRVEGYIGDEERGALDRAIARLRADLAKMDGPAEGFVRHWYVDDEAGAYRCSRDEARRRARYQPGSFVLFVDVPLPRVVEVAGTVEVAK